MDIIDEAADHFQTSGSVAMAYWRELVDKLPTASCLLSDHMEQLVLHGNARFYQLIGCSRSEFQYRYGGRLSAITIGEWPPPHRKADGETVETVQRLRMEGPRECWLHINARYSLVDGVYLLWCVISDISMERQASADFVNCRSVFERASFLAGSETFEYDIVTKRAVIYHQGEIIQQLSWEEQESCGSFEQVFIEKGLVDQADETAFKNAFVSIARSEAAVCEIRMYTSQGKQQWVRLSMAIKEPGSGKCTKAVGILQNMTELKAANLRYLGEAQFLQGILSEKDSYIQVDVSADKLLRVGGRWLLYSGLIHSVSYSRLLDEYLRKTIHPDDEAYYLEFMSLENMIQSLDNGINRLSCRVRRSMEHNCISWIEIHAFLFRNPFSQNIEAVVCSERMEKRNLWTSVPGEPHGELVSSQAALTADDTNCDLEFAQFLSANGDLAYLVDMDTFELLQASEALYNCVGLTKSECQGKPCYWVMHRRENPCPFCGRTNWSKDEFYVWKNWNAVLRQDFLVKNKIVHWRGRDVLFAIAVGVSSNKVFLDSLEDGGGESHSVLSGIQGMSEADTLDDSIQSALETIGGFFRAGAVQYWAYQQSEETFSCRNEWKFDSDFFKEPSEQRVSESVNQWVHKLRWTYPVNIENQEAMLCHSFEMYELLKEAGIWNQRWVPLREGNTLWGIFVIMNISNHFHNTSFLDSFFTFMLEEWRNKARVDEMVYASSHDELTGLLNRKSYGQDLLDFLPDKIQSLGVVSTCINDLENINNQQGFQIGDECILHFASKFQTAFQEGKIYRLGGGEFIAILPNIDMGKLVARLEELEDEVVSCRRYSIAASYSWDNIEKDLPILIQQASQSMKLNKRRQSDLMQQSSDEERRTMVQNLMTSLENREFEVFLQPKVNLFTGKLMGAEALIRYRDKEKGIIPPSRFIDILEKNDLIRFVDFFVFEECCRVLEAWKDRGLQLPIISFNFSRLTLLERDIVSSVQSIFKKYKIPKANLEIEITESVADLGKGVLYQSAHELYQAGFSLSLDDFGTKYTNLDILSELDFDMLKVDKSLVSSLTKRRSNQIILHNIITMCKHLNISVIAEGIETKMQETVLRSLGCRYGQGYLYGRPMPIADFEKTFMTEPTE